MKLYNAFTLIALGSSLLFSCEPEGGKKGSPNAPEIVSRTDETEFNKVPGIDPPHGIDRFAEAGEAEGLLRTMAASGSFKRFSEAVHLAGLAETLSNNEEYTVFAPTDKAFSKIPQERLDNIYLTENKQQLIELVHSHIVKGTINPDDLVDGTPLTTINGKTINIKKAGGQITANNKIVVEQNVAENGALYALDDVIMSPGS